MRTKVLIVGVYEFAYRSEAKAHKRNLQSLGCTVFATMTGSQIELSIPETDYDKMVGAPNTQENYYGDYLSKTK